MNLKVKAKRKIKKDIQRSKKAKKQKRSSNGKFKPGYKRV